MENQLEKTNSPEIQYTASIITCMMRRVNLSYFLKPISDKIPWQAYLGGRFKVHCSISWVNVSGGNNNPRNVSAFLIVSSFYFQLN